MVRPQKYDEETVAEWRRLLVDEGWTLRELAAKVGCDAATIRRRVGNLGKRTGPREYDLDPEEVATTYGAIGSEQATADEYGVSRSVIRRRLYLAGVRPHDFHRR